MANAPVVDINDFPGINLAIDPINMGAKGATNLINVEVRRPGRIYTRTALGEINDLDGWSAGNILTYENSDGAEHYIIQRAVIDPITADEHDTIEAYSVNQTNALDTVSLPDNSGIGPGLVGARFGDDAGNEYLYFADGTGEGYRWDGTSLTTPTGLPSTAYNFAVWSVNNRLVVQSDVSTLSFSDQGAPETFNDNTVDLTPGDGEAITGLLAWQNKLFAFKKTKFFVFTSEGESDIGDPIFNYYPVNGRGASYLNPVAGNEGIYFYDGASLWVTDGDNTKLISDDIAPFLRGEVEFKQFTAQNAASPSLAYAVGRLYVSFKKGGIPGFTFIYDPHVNAWTAMTAYADGVFIHGVGTLHRSVDTPYELFLADNTISTIKIAKFDSTETQDGGTEDIAWVYETGYVTPADTRKITLRESILWGIGDVQLEVLAIGGRSTDLPDPSPILTLGTTDVASAQRRTAIRGTRFATKLSGTGAAVVSGISHIFRAPEGQD